MNHVSQDGSKNKNKRVFHSKKDNTTRDLTLGDVLFMSQKWLFSLCFAFCDVRVTKMQSSPNVGHKMYSVTKTCVFVTNFVTILAVSLICDARILSLPSPKKSQNLCHG